MQIKNRSYTLLAVLALVAASTLALTGAFAGDEVTPKTDAPAAATGARAEKTEAVATKTPSPMHTLMGWMSKQAVGDLDSPCPSCPKAEAAWRAWFAGGADVPLAGLRDRLVADGWTADRYVGYFQEMAKAHPKAGGDCAGKASGDCDKGCDDCPGKASGECDKGCTDCPGKAANAGKGCDSCPGGCPEKRGAEPAPQGTAAK